MWILPSNQKQWDQTDSSFQDLLKEILIGKHLTYTTFILHSSRNSPTIVLTNFTM